jgi:hypothetical protein
MRTSSRGTAGDPISPNVNGGPCARIIPLMVMHGIFPINFLLVEALQKYYRFYGDDVLIEYPTGSGKKLTLGQIAEDLSRRLTSIFLRDEQGRRPVFGGNTTFQNDEYWRDHVPFHEYFHGDNGAGIGASHQTGWTAVVANLLQTSQAAGTSEEAAKATRKAI